MGYAINPLACVSFGGNKSGKKKKTEPAAAPVPAATEVTKGNNQSVGPKRAEAAAAGKRGRGGKAEAAPYRGGFMPYRPLHSYDIDPVANAMYFWGSVGQIVC
ncbi:unnamed protein product [Alopecurus aequalis]